jgi:hypothetical protein
MLDKVGEKSGDKFRWVWGLIVLACDGIGMGLEGRGVIFI